MFTLENKTAIVTGAAGGIGAACALMFARHGIGAMVLTDVREDRLAAGAAAIEKETGLKSVCVACDIRKEEACKTLAARAGEQMGRVDILLNCAGVSKRGSLYDVTEEQWDFTFDINVKGLFFICREVYRMMEKQGGGCIINLASQAARGGGLVVSPDYPSSKAAVLTLTKSLAKSGAARRIRVNTVSPGLITTEMTADFGYDPAAVPLGRLGTGEDVAGAALFLASDYASYITGACIDVNGGIAMI
ncbi:MAG: SDR family oxidoreductase [Treponema sp.]|jgi:3-oxoacyl-[acyl-carrier protein] reductase|nr:SDR family oxidoreductase [Treponema sp.]